MVFPLVNTLFNLGLGAALGVAGGLLGIGGGLIAIPVLGYLYGMDQHLAQGTALVMIAPNVLLGFLRYHQRNRIDLRSVASIAVFAMVTTYVAARLASGIDAGLLRIAFAVFLILLALYFGRRPKGSTGMETPARPMPRAALPVLGMFSGAMSGIFTVGGGLIVVPALVSLFGEKQTRAQGMGLALAAPGSLIALVAYAQGGHVDWVVGLPMAVGGVLSVSWGVALAHQFSPARLRLCFSVVLVGTAVLMLLGGR